MDYALAVNLRPVEQDKSLDELTYEVEMATHLSGAKTIDALNRRVGGVLGRFGVDKFCHADLSRIDRPGVLGLLDPVGNFDPKTTDRYVQEGFHTEDLMTWHLANVRTPIFRSTLMEQAHNVVHFDRDRLKRNKDVNKFLREIGMLDVYNIPVVCGENYNGVFSISVHHGEPQPFRKAVEANANIVFPLADTVDRVLRTKFAREISEVKESRFPVSNDTLYTLELMAKKDLTACEVAEVLGIHEQTVQKRIAAGKRATGTHTVQGLLLALIKAGLISIYG
jgi:Autoinducer binding domain